MPNGWFLVTTIRDEGALAGACHPHDCDKYIGGAIHASEAMSWLRAAKAYRGCEPPRNEAEAWFVSISVFALLSSLLMKATKQIPVKLKGGIDLVIKHTSTATEPCNIDEQFLIMWLAGTRALHNICKLPVVSKQSTPGMMSEELQHASVVSLEHDRRIVSLKRTHASRRSC